MRRCNMADAEKPKDLQDLLTRAMARQTPVKPRRKPSDTISPKELAQAEKRLRDRFNDPANWERVRTVALIHDETETLLGNFEEFRSKLSVGVCRKLKRVEGPAAVDAIERVSGQQWLNPLPMEGRIDSLPAHEEREAIIDLHLPELDNTFASDVLVTVELHWGSIAKVILDDETTFKSKDGKVHLILPAGLDVREGLSLETKLRIKEFLGL